ncbi:dystroglycan 1-like isoform X1 [Podarcis raffonei]|uniref:dystroglycan 1-like isoform X1 n=2 Tax=Podarcis raffonei TaxID=65483 RepID=UPI0023293CFD|nr:dystroglycan 1-like isoform X1 [Podarcis raffonei]
MGFKCSCLVNFNNALFFYSSDLCGETTTSTFLDYYTAYLRMAASDICLSSGATWLLQRQIPMALSLLLTLVYLTAIRPAAVAKELLHRTCGEIQALQGVQDARAVAGRVFSYPISPFAFQGKITHYKVTLASGSALPMWLEYNPNTNTLQGLPMVEESGEYHLTIVAYGESCGWKTPTAGANFAIHVHNDALVREKEVVTDQQHNSICSAALCERGMSVTFAEIIIHTENYLEIQKRLDLVCTMADYLHLHPSSLTLASFESPFNKHYWNLTILAEDIQYLNTMKKHCVGIHWPVGFGVFTMLYELVQILQHNVVSNHLSQLLGYEIAGWRILKKEGNGKNHLGKRQRRQLMATPGLVLRPTKIESLTILSTTMVYTQSAIIPSESSSLLYEAVKEVIPTYMDALGSMDIQMLLNGQSKTQVSGFFQSLSSELSPSLISPSTEFEGKVASRTPTILEELQSQVPQQNVYSVPKKSKPKHNSTLHFLDFSVPMSKTQISIPAHNMETSVSPDVTASRTASLAYSEELTRSLDYTGAYAQLTASGLLSKDTIYVANLPLPSISTLMNLRASPRVLFSNVVVSLLSSDGSYEIQDLLSNYKHVSESLMSLPQTTTLIDVPSRNVGFSLIGITSLGISGASVHKFRLPVNTSPSQFYYSNNASALAMHSSQQFRISPFVHSLEFGFLSRTSNTPAMAPSLSLSTPAEFPVSFGHSNMIPMGENLSERTQVSQQVIKIYTLASESFMTVPETDKLLISKTKLLAPTTSQMDTFLWETQHLIYDASSSASVSSSRFHEGDPSYKMSQSSECYSYDALPPTWSTEFAGTPKLSFSTDEIDSYDINDVRTHKPCLDALQLDTSDLSLDSSFGTKINLQITRDLTLELLEKSTITSNKDMSRQTGFYVTSLYQGPINTSPRVVNAIKWITATIGHNFFFSVPPDTFYDQEDGDTTQLTLEINPADGSPTGSESWLQFNSDDQTMYGYPLDHDFQYSPQEFLLFATDSGGLRTSDTLTIVLLRPTTIPCHTYTIRTKNSYHSFLRDRDRVNLFFEKLSKYLIAGCPGNMTLLDLKPGSTVITWYNSCFCTRASGCARDEIQGVLRKLRVPGGNTNPHFVEAMLPAYKIDRIEEVAFGGICSPITKPVNESLISNSTLATFDNHCWIRNIFTSLLISVSITIIVILMVAFHCCRHPKKITGLQSTTFHGRPFFSYIDLEMDMLKSRKSPMLEQESPPSAQLWLPVPTPSPQHIYRTKRNLVASGLPPPPKYRLPPFYGMQEPSQTHQDASPRRYYPKASLY